MGVTVWITSALGTGVDVVLGLKNDKGVPINILVEIKDGDKPPSQQKLTQDEEKFHNEWKGQISIITNEEQAMNLIHHARGIKDVDFRVLPCECRS